MVITTIMLYYLYYVEGAVTPLILPYYHMSFQYFLYLLVVLERSRCLHGVHRRTLRQDRAGEPHDHRHARRRSCAARRVPHIHSKFGFVARLCGDRIRRGVILVSTPALIRDFSPQMGRGAAMGFWALGPVDGEPRRKPRRNHTLPHLGPWQDQFIISGVVCMVVVVISFYWPPGARTSDPRPN